MVDVSHYTVLADLFEYPKEGYKERINGVAYLIKERYPEFECHIDTFIQLMPDSYELAGDLYTRSFDVQAVTTLDVGYVLFGDDYKRGELLSHLNREHNQVGNNCGDELADNLANILRLMSKLSDENLKEELVEDILVPAIKRMISEFQPERLEALNLLYKKQYKTIIDSSPAGYTMYLSTLRVIDAILRKDFKIVDKPEKIESLEFLQSLETEFKIEPMDKTAQS